MKIQIESNDFEEKCYCHLCGNTFFPIAVVARAYKESGEYLTDVCPECIATGSEGISLRMRQRADSLRTVATELERLARTEIDSPSLAQLNVANQLEKALR
ncbi:MAG TPA: hypothetical protein DCL61_28060 [Cyanobacteria bacterium UBA12227]|nr:hypothetical protein [Cyanobacteria bacterium UBA12227]HAX86933.1 hypothetical protein [Cyanobacteria bacterium UBA11370]HBY75785.1 hypothetical protein [Cyanobacteria bacterium UBA11148]